MITSASKAAHVAAGIVCAVFVPFVLIHLLWAVGVTWGLEEVSPGSPYNHASIELTFASLVGAAAGSAALIVTLGRVGWLMTPLSDALLRVGNWVVFAWPAIGMLNPESTWGQRAVALPLAIAALVVARSRTHGASTDHRQRRPAGTPVTR